MKLQKFILWITLVLTCTYGLNTHGQEATSPCPQYASIISLLLDDPSKSLTELRKQHAKARPWFKRLSRQADKEQWSELNRAKLESFFDGECRRHNLVDDLHRGTLTGLQVLKELVEVPVSAVVGLLQGIFSRRDSLHLHNQQSFFYESQEFLASDIANAQLTALAAIPWWQYQVVNQLWQHRMQQWCRQFRLSNKKSFVAHSCDEFKKIDLWSTQLSQQIKSWMIKQKQHLWDKREDHLPNPFWWVDVGEEADFCSLALEQQHRMNQNTAGWKRKHAGLQIDYHSHKLTHLTSNYVPVTYNYTAPVIQQAFPAPSMTSTNLMMGIGFYHPGLKTDAIDTIDTLVQMTTDKIKQQATMLKTVTKLMQAKTVKECLAAKSISSFTIKGLQKIHLEITQYDGEAAQLQRNQMFVTHMQPLIGKAVQKSNLAWAHLSINHVNALMAALRTNQVDHLFLTMHADQEGRLHDSLGNIVPKEVFSLIGTRLKSILILSCHIDKVLTYYQLPKYLAVLPSTAGLRQLTIIKEKKYQSKTKQWILSNIEKLYIQAFSDSFKYFEAILKSLNRETSFLTHANSPLTSPTISEENRQPTLQCRLKLPPALVQSIERDSSTLLISSDERKVNQKTINYLAVIDSKERPFFAQQVNHLSIFKPSLTELVSLFSKPTNLSYSNYDFTIPCPSLTTQESFPAKINLIFENIRFAPESDRRNIKTSEGAEVFGLPDLWKTENFINDIQMTISREGENGKEEEHYFSSSQRVKGAIFKNEDDTVRRALNYRLELLPATAAHN